MNNPTSYATYANSYAKYKLTAADSRNKIGASRQSRRDAFSLPPTSHVTAAQYLVVFFLNRHSATTEIGVHSFSKLPVIIGKSIVISAQRQYNLQNFYFSENFSHKTFPSYIGDSNKDFHLANILYIISGGSTTWEPCICPTP